MSYIFLILVILIIFFVFSSYNKLQRSAQRVKECLSNISVSLQKKVNLVNQLIDVVKNYQDGEQLVHLSISRNATQSDLVSSQMEANKALIGVQGFLQRFPELKANEQYTQLMQSINNIENEVSYQRERYNEAVREYNTQRSTIPTVFVANALKFPEAPYLDFSQENIEQNLLRDFNTNSGEHLNALLSSATNSLKEGSKTIVNKAVETGKRISENETVQDLKARSTEKLTELKSELKDAIKTTPKPEPQTHQSDEEVPAITVSASRSDVSESDVAPSTTNVASTTTESTAVTKDQS